MSCDRARQRDELTFAAAERTGRAVSEDVDTKTFGRVVRRSTLELLGYEVVDEPEDKGRPARRRLFGRRNRGEDGRRTSEEKSLET